MLRLKQEKRILLHNPLMRLISKKQMKILKTADMYMYENNIDKECRFDVCEVFVNSDNLKLVGINYIEDAF